MAPHFKPGIGLQTVVFPYSNGTVMVVEASRNPFKVEFRSDSATLADAIRRTRISNVASDDSHSLSGRSVYVTGTKIVLMKSDAAEQWTDDAPMQDSKDILNYIISKGNGNS